MKEVGPVVKFLKKTFKVVSDYNETVSLLFVK